MFSDFFYEHNISPEKPSGYGRNLHRPGSNVASHDNSYITNTSHVHQVAVHVTKVSSLPEPFTLHEFRMVCQMQGLPVDDSKQRKHKQHEM